MSDRQVVLLGADGSPASLRGLEWAVGAAKRLGWPIHVATAYALPTFSAASIDGGYAALDDSAIAQGAQSVLDEAVARVKAAGVPVTSSLETGDAVAVLVDLSREAGLAVVGTRGRGGFADRVLGTVSSALPAHSYCPTVVVPSGTARRGGMGLDREAVDSEPRSLMPVEKIVVGVDGSPAAEIALRQAAKQARLWGAELTVIGGVPINVGSGALAWLPAVVDRAQVLADVQVGLDIVVDRVLKDMPDVDPKRIVLDGTGAELLTEFSSAVDLVVVGSRGRGGFAGMLLGSTSQTVLHHAACPVMVVTNRCAIEDEEASSAQEAQNS